MGSRVVVIVNPTSGRGRSGKLLPEIRQEIHTLGLDAEVRVSRSAEDPPRIARESAEAGAEIVAAMGGDGMTGMVGGALAGTQTALGVIPTGTGNDFARFIGLNRRQPVAAVAVLADPDVRAIDAAQVTGGGREERFINVAGAGFDSEVNETANNMKWKAQGTAKYVAAVVGTLRRFSPAQFEVTVDGSHRSLSGMLIAVGNGESYGGGMRVAAGASLTDGLLEVCVPAGVPEGVPGDARHAPQGDDAPGSPGRDLVGPAVRRLRRRGALGAAARRLPGAAGGAEGRVPQGRASTLKPRRFR
jgi:diacylglycerol kinase (ATP)